MIADPPLELGGFHATTIWPSPDVAPTPVGDVGTVYGTALLAAEADADAPTELNATTVTGYDVPFTKFVIGHVNGPEVQVQLNVCVPLRTEITYFEIDAPRAFGADQVTVIC